MSRLADFLREKRLEKGLSVRAAAKEAGISDDYLMALEESRNRATGKESNPSPEILRRIAHGYGVPYWQLMDLAGYLPEELTPPILEVLTDPRNKDVLSLMETPEDLAAVLRVIHSVRGKAGK